MAALIPQTGAMQRVSPPRGRRWQNYLTERNKPLKILMLGAGGFIGSHLTTRLLAEGHNVTGFDLNGDKLDTLAAHHRFTFLGRDIREDEGELAELAAASDLVPADTNAADDVFVVTMAHYILNVTLAGRGIGTVSSSPAGIDCGIDCGEVYEGVTGVVLTSTPDADSKFRGWGGNPDCADGSVTMNTDISCTATFTSFPWIMFNNILTGRGEK